MLFDPDFGRMLAYPDEKIGLHIGLCCPMNAVRK